MSEHRALSLLEIKSFDRDERVIEGIASTPELDRQFDIVEPMGAKFTLPIPLLWQHDHGQPIGHVEWAKATPEGIQFRARLVKVDDAGKLKDRLDEAWQSIKAGLIRAVSIGFSALKYHPLENGGRRFTEWGWHELSAVTVPACAGATIASVKAHIAETGKTDSAPPVLTIKRTASTLIKSSEKVMSTISAHPQGSAFVRTIQAMAATKGQMGEARQYAAARWGEGAAPVRLLKAAVSAGTTEPGNWGAEMAEYGAAEAEFFSLVRQQTVFGRLSGMRRVPANVRLTLQTSGATAAWVGETGPTPVSALSFATDRLETLKLAALVVISDELAENSSPEAEGVIRADLVRAMAEQLDLSFLNPANAGEAAVSPASITNSAPGSAATIDPEADIKALIADFDGELARAYIVAAPSVLAALSGAAFPNVGARGGDIKGIPALPSDAAGNVISLIDPGGIAYSEDTTEIMASQDASVQMSDDPLSGATQLVSLFQTNSTGIRLLKFINWRRVQTGAVRVITGVGY
jgi:HK97 family phage prohead protease|tara:strand:- start:489 stop:2051 length:1563 start_codon:yes stop_codon:yes gene_type:complete